MGVKATLACLALFACHVALVLNLVSVTSKEWVDSEIKRENGTAATNTTCIKGLWDICCTVKGAHHTHCTALDHSLQNRMYKYIEGLYLAGIAMVFVAMVMSYGFVLLSKLYMSIRTTVLIALAEFISTTLLLVALVLQGLYYAKSKDLPTDKLSLELGWGYWVAVSGAVVTALASVVSVLLIQHMRKRNLGYESF